ncbi:PilZ domain-containing protein [Ectothiorhodospira marina]|jgi:hypothetical protein|uniref:PilZ domain-containing protein n=1 Tax=Ectothiorhodospira marina TaxID=1396821 RepID=A0A1H7JZ36_9GAMM|nr:PilZ domain-containing protein [Ectothiorhodospira marina]SEK79546.1 PilZ domain-containing protein [Ectothiorhodospira marina]
MESDRRQHPRLPVEVAVELFREGQPARRVQTRDLSGNGVLLLISGEDAPVVGERIQVRVEGTLGDGEAPPVVHGRVVRVSDREVAVEFLAE